MCVTISLGTKNYGSLSALRLIETSTRLYLPGGPGSTEHSEGRSGITIITKQKRHLADIAKCLLIVLVAGTGFEPVTFGL